MIRFKGSVRQLKYERDGEMLNSKCCSHANVNSHDLYFNVNLPCHLENISNQSFQNVTFEYSNEESIPEAHVIIGAHSL